MKTLEMFKLDGKTAVVTGGATGYGKQVIESLLEAGATVCIASRSYERNVKKAEEYCSMGYKAYALPLDLESEQSILELCDNVYKKSGKVDILVNNAVLRSMKSYKDTAENFAKSMAANATGLFIICRAFCDKMAKDGGGSVINIGSYMGILGPEYALYEGTEMNKDGVISDYFYHKGGMTNYTRFLAGHYGKFGIRANCVELGGLFDNQPELFVKRYGEKTMLGRMANDTDLKGLIAYLASDASAYMTGAIIPLDGGYSAK